MNIFLNILFLILIVILIFVCIVLFTKVTLAAEFKKAKGQKAKKTLVVRLPGGLIKINLLSLKNKAGKKNKHIAQKNNESEKTGAENDLKFFDKVRSNYGKFLDFKSAYNKSSHKIRKAIYAKKIHLDACFGLGDAAKTGIATGCVWAGIYAVVSFVSGVIRITEPKINVIPAYNDLKCEVSGSLEIKARLINLLIAAVSFGITYKKLRKIREKNKKGGD